MGVEGLRKRRSQEGRRLQLLVLMHEQAKAELRAAATSRGLSMGAFVRGSAAYAVAHPEVEIQDPYQDPRHADKTGPEPVWPDHGAGRRLVLVERCPRCRGAHGAGRFDPLRAPVGGKWTHWWPCPATGEPVLLRMDQGAEQLA